MTGDFISLRVGEQIDLGFDWSTDGWLGAQTIATSSWALSESGPTISAGTNNTTTTAVIIGPALAAHFGKTYSLVNTISDSAGNEGVRAYTVRVVNP